MEIQVQGGVVMVFRTGHKAQAKEQHRIAERKVLTFQNVHNGTVVPHHAAEAEQQIVGEEGNGLEVDSHEDRCSRRD